MQFNKQTITCFILIVGGVGMISSLISCKKLVEVDPPIDTITASEVFSSKTQANSVLAGMYSMMMSNSGELVFSNGAITRYAGMSSDEITNFQGSANSTDYQFYTNNLTPQTTEVESKLWSPAYYIIYVANSMISKLEITPSTNVDDSTRKQFSGEAKFIRAFCYFYLTNLFGEVPLVLTTDYTKTATMARTPQAAVYAQIEKDLEEAKEALYLDYSVAAGERVRATKWAAAALLARVYLFNKKWAQAEAMASEVIGNNQFTLEPNLRDVFKKNSREAIFQLKGSGTVDPYYATWDGTGFISSLRFSSLSQADKDDILVAGVYDLYASFIIAPYYLSHDYVKAFENGDQRKWVWIDSTDSPVESPWNSVKFYTPYKYTLQYERTGAASEYYMVLRLAEQYLIRVEARAQLETNPAGAAADINQIRTRAGLLGTTAATKTELLEAVLHERQTELFAEWGHRWFDLKRMDKANDVLSQIATKQGWSANKLLYPIPAGEIRNNPAIKQNPGY